MYNARKYLKFIPICYLSSLPSTIFMIFFLLYETKVNYILKILMRTIL